MAAFCLLSDWRLRRHGSRGGGLRFRRGRRGRRLGSGRGNDAVDVDPFEAARFTGLESNRDVIARDDVDHLAANFAPILEEHILRGSTSGGIAGPAANAT